jgi:hypothetical protein
LDSRHFAGEMIKPKRRFAAIIGRRHKRCGGLWSAVHAPGPLLADFVAEVR